MIAVHRPRKKRLSTTIFATVLTFSILIVAAVAVSLSALYHTSYESDAEAKLIERAQDAAAKLDGMDTSRQIESLQNQLDGTIRYTLIALSGEVLFDSVALDQGQVGDAATGQDLTDGDETSSLPLENHADRPEVQQAFSTGVASSARYSQTLKDDTIYAAVRLDSGDVLRLSESRESLFAFMNSMVGPLALILVLVVSVVVVFSRLLTRRIMAPLDEVDLGEGFKNTGYVEMEPLLGRIDEQQQQLREQNRELMRAEGMRRDFSANVSHEMKTPLQVIAGYSEVLSTGLVPKEDVVKFAGIIHDESQHMHALIDDVLVLSRLDEPVSPDGSTDVIDLFLLAKQVAERLRPLAEKQGVILRVHGSEVLLRGNESLIEQVMSNLVSNAIRYNEVGGEVVLSVTKDCHADAIIERSQHDETQEGSSFDAASSGEYGALGRADAVIRVKDTGMGVPADEQDKIFERFYRVDKSRSKETGGTGLGLAIVKHAVEHHNGTIEVKSEQGCGSTFTVRIPLT